MDFDQAQEILRQHRPVPWLARLIGLASCQACGHRWRCPAVTEARQYIESLTPPIPPEWRVDW